METLLQLLELQPTTHQRLLRWWHATREVGYQEALRTLVGADGISALCVTEA